LQAAEAAKNTADLIEGTVKRVQNGSALVEKTAGAFERVAGGARHVGELIGEIKAASDEQAQGIGCINSAVAEMEQVTHRNAAQARQSASASKELHVQAERMKTFAGELIALTGGNHHAGRTAEQERRSAEVRARLRTPERMRALLRAEDDDCREKIEAA
jgi:methyl-accepting chemotaxis protein